MAISHVSTGSLYSSTSTGSSITLNTPPSITDDDLYVAYVAVEGIRTLTPPAGWTLKRTIQNDDTGSQGGQATVFILLRDGESSDPSSFMASLSSSTTRRFARVIAYRGCDEASNQFLDDDPDTDDTNTPLTRSTGTVNNTDPDAWRLAFFAVHDNAVNIGTPNFFNVSSGNNERFDDHISFNNPAITVVGYDSDGTISTGNTDVETTWTTNGSGSSMNFSISWIGLLSPAGEESESESEPPPPPGSGLTGGTSYQMFLAPEAADVGAVFVEDQDTPIDAIILSEAELLDWEVFEDPIVFNEDASPILDQFTIVFNESRQSPGFDITIKGLLEPLSPFQQIDVFRRDPSGRYSDQRVRGLADVTVSQNDMFVTDYEAPLNTVLHYYLRLVSSEGEFEHGPFLPTPLPYIPTLRDAYAGGTAYMKVIDNPVLSRPLMVESMNSFSRSSRVLGTYEVLGRRNPVVITDVLGGREGEFSAFSVLQKGQRIEEIEFALAPGVTILLQNHNPTTSTFHDMYIKITGVDFEVITPQMTVDGELENRFDRDVIVKFTCEYVQVDRPDPLGEVILVATWGSLNDTHDTWKHVKNRYDAWNDVYLNPFAPESS